MSRDVIGFGEPSRRHRTVTRNAFVRIITQPAKGGADVCVQSMRGLRLHPIVEVSEDGRSATLHVRSYDAPRVGSRQMLDGALVKVADVRYDSSGRCFVVDEDTGAQHPWPGEVGI